MPKTAVAAFTGKETMKDIRRTIREKLTISLADYRSIVGEKKFDNRIRKTARRLGEDFAEALTKKQKKSEKNELAVK